MIDTKKEAIEYFDHNPHSEGVVFIMIDKSNLINDDEIDDTCDFSISETIDNENVITKEKRMSQILGDNVIAFENGEISIHELCDTTINYLKGIKGGNNDKWKVY